MDFLKDSYDELCKVMDNVQIKVSINHPEHEDLAKTRKEPVMVSVSHKQHTAYAAFFGGFLLGMIFSGGIAFMAYPVHIPFIPLTQGVTIHKKDIMTKHTVTQQVLPLANAGASKHSENTQVSHPNSDAAGKAIGTGLYAMMYLIG